MPTPNPETLEQAREMLLQQSNDLDTLRGELDTLRNESSKKDTTIEELRTLNQKFYLQLAQQQEEPEPEPEPELSLEDFARTLKGLI